MEPRLKRNMLLVAIVHAVVIVVLIAWQWIASLFDREKPKELVTYVELATVVQEPAPMTPEVVAEPPPPEPPPPEPKAVEPPPIAPPKPKKKKIEVSKKRVRRKQDAPPPKAKPPSRRTGAEDVRKMLSPVLSSPSNAAVNDFPYDWYYALVRRACYESWDRPSTAAVRPGTKAVVSIRVHRDGSVREHQLVRASGNRAMDDSVLRAVRGIPRLKPLPAQYKKEFKDITIDFELAGNT